MLSVRFRFSLSGCSCVLYCFVVRRAGGFVLLTLWFSAALFLMWVPGGLWCPVISIEKACSRDVMDGSGCCSEIWFYGVTVIFDWYLISFLFSMFAVIRASSGSSLLQWVHWKSLKRLWWDRKEQWVCPGSCAFHVTIFTSKAWLPSGLFSFWS